MENKNLVESQIKLQVTIGRGKMTFTHGMCNCKKVWLDVGNNILTKTADDSRISLTEMQLYQMATSGNWDALEDDNGVILGQRGIQIYIPYDQA